MIHNDDDYDDDAKQTKTTYVIAPAHDLVVIEVDGGSEPVSPQAGPRGGFDHAGPPLLTPHRAGRHGNQEEAAEGQPGPSASTT